jgi:hypothetical protein
MAWRVTHRADPRAVRIADRHYNRQSPAAFVYAFGIAVIIGLLLGGCDYEGCTGYYVKSEDVYYVRCGQQTRASWHRWVVVGKLQYTVTRVVEVIP